MKTGTRDIPVDPWKPLQNRLLFVIAGYVDQVIKHWALQRSYLPNSMPESSEKKILPAFLICFFLGILGIHRFYVGKTGSGIAQLLTLGGLGVWVFIDWIMIMCGSFKDSDGKPLTEWT